MKRLKGRRPTQDAGALLRTLAESHQRPDLAEKMEEPWRREQISALVWDIFRKRESPIELHEMLLLPAMQRHANRTRKLSIRDWRSLFPMKASRVVFAGLAGLILLYRHFFG